VVEVHPHISSKAKWRVDPSHTPFSRLDYYLLLIFSIFLYLFGIKALLLLEEYCIQFFYITYSAVDVFPIFISSGCHSAF